MTFDRLDTLDRHSRLFSDNSVYLDALDTSIVSPSRQQTYQRPQNVGNFCGLTNTYVSPLSQMSDDTIDFDLFNNLTISILSDDRTRTNFNNLIIVNRSPTLIFISAVLAPPSHHSCKYLHSSHTTSILSPTRSRHLGLIDGFIISTTLDISAPLSFSKPRITLHPDHLDLFE